MNKYIAILATTVMVSAMQSQAQIKTITADDGWDIYEAGIYRYGPSFITYEDGSMDAWFAAPGQEYEDCVLYNPGSSCTPKQVSSVSYAAQYIEIDRPFIGFSVYSPTWGKNGTEKVRMSIFKWNSSPFKTRQGTPLAQVTHSGYSDNAILSVTTEGDVELEPGAYLFVLDNASSYAGVYHYSQRNTDFGGCVYMTGVKYDGALRGHVIYDSKKIIQYWDQASYQHSEDGGMTWNTEQMVIKPTRGTRDELSICDPGVARWGGYYYLGYTSTEHTGGLENHLYMARSEHPTGPWEKWNGTGWGGDKVEPIVEYPLKGGWGIGEPSMVVKDDKVYLYYTYDSGTPTTRVATAPADREDWPALLEQLGTAIVKTGGSDHCDVKYVDAAKRFLAVNTAKRMTTNSYIQMWQSADGVNFEPIGDGRIAGIMPECGLHNCGLNGDEQGHIDITKPQHIAYAYGLTGWAAWSTFLQPITIEADEQSGITSITVDSTLPVKMYDITGREIDPETAPAGLYVTRQGDHAEKVVRR